MSCWSTIDTVSLKASVTAFRDEQTPAFDCVSDQIVFMCLELLAALLKPSVALH